jgi:hypothetical protein
VCFYRLIKDFERVVKDETGHVDPNTARMLNERKQSQVMSQELIKLENLPINLAVVILQPPLTLSPEFVLFGRSRN